MIRVKNPEHPKILPCRINSQKEIFTKLIVFITQNSNKTNKNCLDNNKRQFSISSNKIDKG
jgi:hypothetical protein